MIFQSKNGKKRKCKCITASVNLIFIVILSTCIGLMIIAVFTNVTGCAFLMAMAIPCVACYQYSHEEVEEVGNLVGHAWD